MYAVYICTAPTIDFITTLTQLREQLRALQRQLEDLKKSTTAITADRDKQVCTLLFATMSCNTDTMTHTTLQQSNTQLSRILLCTCTCFVYNWYAVCLDTLDVDSTLLGSVLPAQQRH
jgi:hypothetical protein